MLILVFIDVQYLLKVVFSFEEGSNIQNHSFSGSQHPTTKFLSTKFSILPPTGEEGCFPHSLKLASTIFYRSFIFHQMIALQ